MIVGSSCMLRDWVENCKWYREQLIQWRRPGGAAVQSRNNDEHPVYGALRGGAVQALLAGVGDSHGALQSKLQELCKRLAS